MLFRRQEWCWTSCLFFLVHRCSSFFWEKLSKLEEDKSFELFGYLNCSSVPSWGAPGNGGVPQSNDYVKALGNGDSQTLQLFALSIVYIQEFGLLTLVTAKSFSSWLHPKVWTILLQFSPSQYGMSGSARRRVTFLAQGRGPTWWRLYNLVQTREQLKEKEDFWGMKGENGCTGQGREFVVTITLKITNHQVHPLLPILVVLNAHLK